MSVLACRAVSDGSQHRSLWCEFPASRNLGSRGVARGERLTHAAIEEGKIFPRADFEVLRTLAIRHLPCLLDELIEESDVAHVDAAIVAHLDPRTEAEICEILAPRVGRLIARDTVYAYSASLPLAFARAMESHVLHSGEVVALLTAGGGASWGACIVRV